jgi:[ribosomal protein S18]-alanine N-acetyltransferase
LRNDLTLSIRLATAADVPAIMALEKTAPSAAHWSVQQYEGLFGTAEPNRVALVLSDENGLQAFAIARVVLDEWELENIVVAGETRCRGLGTRLLEELLQIARARGAKGVFLEVRQSNQAARALYEKWAFLESGHRRRYYQEPDEDAILYRIEFI